MSGVSSGALWCICAKLKLSPCQTKEKCVLAILATPRKPGLWCVVWLSELLVRCSRITVETMVIVKECGWSYHCFFLSCFVKDLAFLVRQRRTRVPSACGSRAFDLGPGYIWKRSIVKAKKLVANLTAAQSVSLAQLISRMRYHTSLRCIYATYRANAARVIFHLPTSSRSSGRKQGFTLMLIGKTFLLD